MANLKNEIELRRLKILGREEIRIIFELPDFLMEERFEYFSLTVPERDFFDRLRSVSSKLYFILQAGYFKARHLFFNFEFKDVSEDVEYILQIHFSDQDINLKSLRAVAKNTRLSGQQALLKLYRYRWRGKKSGEFLKRRRARLPEFPASRFLFSVKSFRFFRMNALCCPAIVRFRILSVRLSFLSKIA